MKIAARLDRGKIDHNEPGDVHLMVSVDAPEVEEAKRKPMDVCLVIDVSTSMTEAAAPRPDSPDKLALAKAAAARFIENLTAQDRVGLVAYSDGVIVLAPVADLTTVHRRMLAEQIAGLHVIGGTNLVEGTLRGLGCMADLQRKFLAGTTTVEEDRVRRVILLTDGLPTTGITQHAAVLGAIQARLDRRTPITTIGFGASAGAGQGCYDPELLTAIARTSGGNPYHAEGMDGLLEAFALELGSLRSVAAADVRVTITPGSDITVAKCYNDLPTSVKDGATVIDLGSLYGGETQHVVVKLQIPKRDKAFPRDTLAAKVVVSGVGTAGGAFQNEQRAEFRYVEASEADTKPDAVVEEQRLRLKAARAVKRAYEEARAGNHQQAAARIRVVRMQLMQFGSHESQVLVVALQAIEVDIADPSRFAQRAGEIHAASSGMGARRTTSFGPGSYLKDEHTTPGQRRSVSDMDAGGAKPPSSTPSST
ncbi:MAG: VWA domain-containing protein [bacterium]|nr:VWA domain-containing protein [bacterium]